ncbi:hypothetical protein [Legionella sp. km772]|uniref:hypothetical protein n=1 Tax=Legionella sp. km772 TaxID=2498111 RepID=UPI000F8F26A0|nr:hypothetical protein [Legionella sp. km772]RUR04045.1 hypothetical protein ELY15_15900 [Legionella sp. km772]
MAKIFFESGDDLEDEIRFLAYAAGLSFLPRWKVYFNSNKLRYTTRREYRKFFWKRRHYFYYLIHKSE